MPRHRGARARSFVGASALALLLCARPAAAEVPVDLTWDAPRECSSAREILARVERIVRRVPSGRVSVSARVTHPDAARWSVEITTASAGGSGVRAIEGASCAAIVDATALVVALALDPNARTAPEPSPAPPVPPPAPNVEPASSSPGAALAPAPTAEPAPAPARPPNPVASRPALREAATTRASPSHHELGIFAGGGGDAGMLPTLTPLVAVGVGWTPRHFRFEVGAALSGSVRGVSTAVPRVGGDFRLWLAQARGCYALLDREISLGPCVGLELDHVSADGTGADVPQSGSGTWGAALAGALVAWRAVDWLSVRAGGDAVAPFARPRFTVDGGVGAVHRAAWLSGRFELGLEARFF